MNNPVKTELFIAMIDALSLAFVNAMIAGGNAAANGFGLLPAVFLGMALFNVYRANVRYELYKEQKNS